MYRAKQNQEAFLEGGHAWQGSMQTHVTFVTRMGRGWGGDVAGLGPEGCMLLAVHMVPYCRSSGDRFLALLF